MSTNNASYLSENHRKYMKMALLEAQKCIPVPTAFCVGCTLVARWPSEHSTPVVLACGFSRELPGNTHAEANALNKSYGLSSLQLAELFPTEILPSIDILLAHADVYTTLEPCSVRTSGLSPCADALVRANVKRCFIGVGEPDDFVTCEGARRLQQAGIEVIWMTEFEEECLAAARRGHDTT